MKRASRSSKKVSLAFSRHVLQGVNRILQEALTCNSMEALGKVSLQVAEELTQSQFGFVGLFDPQGELLDIAISPSGSDACQMKDQTGHSMLQGGLKAHGLYGQVLRNGKGFYTNTPKAHPDSIGLPYGHPPVDAFLGVPFIHDNAVLGLVGVANRAGGYNDDNLFTLEALAVAMGQAFKNIQTETALRESNDQLRAMFATNNVGMVQADSQTGQLLLVNEPFAKMLGYTLDELTGMTFSELTHPEDRQGDWERFSRFADSSESSYQAEKRYIHKLGGTIWGLVSVNFIRNPVGQIVKTMAIIQDITRLKRMDEELRAANHAAELERKLMEAVFQSLPVGICITDEQGGIIRTNHMDEEIWGERPATEGVDDYREYKAWWANTGALVQPEEWASARAVQKGETVLGQILKIQRFDGNHRIINNSAAPVHDDAGNIIGSAVSLQDITTVWEFTKELGKAKAAAEDANRAKSEFLANMSHEIRTPMTVFMSAIEQLQDLDKNPRHQQLLELAARSSQRLYTLVDEILDFSKIEASQVELDNRWFNVRDCVQQSINLMLPKAQQKELELKLQIEPGTPEDIMGDQYRLGQILINLIGNAIKFTDKGEVSVAVRGHDDILEFSVSDTGIGIPEDKQEKIFHSFSQVDGSTTRTHGGTGLGLAICKGLVELMSGEIHVQSRISKGTTFTFTIPMQGLYQSPIADEEDSRLSASYAPQAHILVADDNPMIREVILMALSHRPWLVAFAETGQEAVEKWQSGNYDVILMDLQMPNMDGIEATRVIRRQEGGKEERIAIIGLTAHANKATLDECLESGMNEVLVKPFETANLFAMIERSLASTSPVVDNS